MILLGAKSRRKPLAKMRMPAECSASLAVRLRMAAPNNDQPDDEMGARPSREADADSKTFSTSSTPVSVRATGSKDPKVSMNLMLSIRRSSLLD